MTVGVLDRGVALARSARGYLPGFGTSASLVAGAVLMFVVGSALVAFRGWPHVGAQPSPGEVVISPSPIAASSSRAGRRLALISTGLPGATAAGGGSAAPGRGAVGLRGPGGAGAAAPNHSLGRPVSASTPVRTTGGGTAAACAAGGCGSGSGTAQPGSGGPGPTQPVKQVLSQTTGTISQTTGTLGGVVSGAGKQIGSVVQRSTGAVSGAVQPVSPPVAAAVGSAGAGANQTVTGVTKTIAGVLSGLTPH